MRVAVVVLLAVLTCSAALAATAPTLTGRVTIASAEPQCSPKGCSAPVGPVTLRFARNGHIRVVKTAADGRVQAWLPAGTYRVSTTRPGAAISPLRVTARHGVTRRITFVLRLNTA